MIFAAPNTKANDDVPEGKARMQAVLSLWAEHGWLRPLDWAFAGFLWHEVPEAPPLLILAAALASHQLGRGHACLDLAATLADPAFALSLPPEGLYIRRGMAPPPLPREALAGVSLTQWQAALEYSALVGSGPGDTPLVRSGTRVYLRRYWHYEQAVRAGIEQRLERSAAVQAALPRQGLRGALDILFPPASTGDGVNWQKLACALAARSSFSIITGGPGTGKTTTVVRLLALLQALALGTDKEGEGPARPLRIRLAAPTGKAAARLNESIAGAVSHLPLAGLAQAEAIRENIPVTVTTLHRLLGSRPDTRHFRHHAGNPLTLEVLVIDEASMVDLEMMAAVLAALPPSARLVLLGDKDQLASVEAGAVLGELCARAREGHYTPASSAWLQEATGEAVAAALIDDGGTALDQAIAMLRHSHRFSAGSGIGQLAEAINSGEPAAVGRIWTQAYADLTYLPLSGGDDAALAALCIAGQEAGARPAQAEDIPGDEHRSRRCGYRHYLEVLRAGQPGYDAEQSAFDAWARAVLQAHSGFQVLCALRRGPWGVEGLNPRIARWLQEAGLIAASEGWYLGRPVLITRNDYGLGLMNGDIGITLALPGKTGQDWIPRVAFPAGDGSRGIKWILPSRLQAVETVYALTVHKAQGSEFSHAALVLPDAISPLLTRELLYTAVTRARHFLTLVNPGSEGLLGQAVQRRVLRASGLLAE